VPPKPADGVHLFLLDGDGILFSEPRQELHALNHSAAFIWCCLEEGLDPDAIGTMLIGRFGLAETEARRFVADSLGQWRDLGLLAGAGEPIVAPSRAAVPAGRREPERPERDFVEQRCYCLLDTTLRLRCTEPAQMALIHPVLAHLAVEDCAADVMLDIFAAPEGHRLCRASEILGGVALDGLAPLVKSQVWLIAINRARYFLYFHAGVIGIGDACLLLPASSGSGKSVLTAALVHSGLDYLSDEAALLVRDGLAIRPLPLSLAVKSDGWSLLEPLFPALALLPIHRREDGKLIRYLPPPAPAPNRDSWTARWLIFPRYAPDVVTELRPLPRVEALRRLLAECLAIPAALDRQNIADLVGWIDGLDCFELPNSSLPEAVSLIRARIATRAIL
jgi:hypothetical protein